MLRDKIAIIAEEDDEFSMSHVDDDGLPDCEGCSGFWHDRKRRCDDVSVTTETILKSTQRQEIFKIMYDQAFCLL